MGLRIRKGDDVSVLSGKGRGKRGKVMRLTPDGQRAYVEGVNQVKRVVRRSRQNPQGGSLMKEASIHVSNLALFDTAAKKGVRFRNQVLADGSKRRISVKTGADLTAA